MARYTGPKNRLARREAVDLGLKTVGSKSHASLLRRLNLFPGVHGQHGRRKMSDFGLQLREKQKVKRIYGMLERQFRRFFGMAKLWKGNTGDKFLELLERRLDNTLYRMCLVPTRTMSRQVIGHGHVLVNGKKVSIPSYLVRPNDMITFRTKGFEIPAIKKILDDKSVKVPDWVERKGPAGKVVRFPLRSDITEEINEQLIIEFYSR